MLPQFEVFLCCTWFAVLAIPMVSELVTDGLTYTSSSVMVGF